ncbi:MAG TPA: hypothetical protein VMZ91_04930 [Candidatus Paceibacterota bacterium]|nr:hypothetical protein [Candidatus Paceibacterota bacterium]
MVDKQLDSQKRKISKCSFCDEKSLSSLHMIINGSVVRVCFCENHMKNYSFSLEHESFAKREKRKKYMENSSILLELKKSELSYLKEIEKEK